MYKLNLKKDKILILAQEINKKFPDLKIRIIILGKQIIVKSSNRLKKEIKKNLETIIKIHFPDNNLSFQEN